VERPTYAEYMQLWESSRVAPPTPNALPQSTNSSHTSLSPSTPCLNDGSLNSFSSPLCSSLSPPSSPSLSPLPGPAVNDDDQKELGDQLKKEKLDYIWVPAHSLEVITPHWLCFLPCARRRFNSHFVVTASRGAPSSRTSAFPHPLLLHQAPSQTSTTRTTWSAMSTPGSAFHLRRSKQHSLLGL